MLRPTRSSVLTSVCLTAALAAGCTTPHFRAVKTSDKLDDFRVAIVDLQAKVTAASAALTALATKPEHELVVALNEFDHEVDGLESAVKRADGRLADLHRHAEAYFVTWKEHAATIEDEELKESSEERRESLAAAVEHVTKAMDPAREEVTAYLAALQDTLKYLSIDLTPQGISAVEDKAKSTSKSSRSVHEQLAEVLEAVEKAAPQFARATPPEPARATKQKP